MADCELYKMTARICTGRHCPECPIDGHCISPFSNEDVAAINKAYNELFSNSEPLDIIELDEDDLMNLLRD